MPQGISINRASVGINETERKAVHQRFRSGPSHRARASVAKGLVAGVAEWLMRQPAKLVGYAREGSNPSPSAPHHQRISRSTKCDEEIGCLNPSPSAPIILNGLLVGLHAKTF